MKNILLRKCINSKLLNDYFPGWAQRSSLSTLRNYTIQVSFLLSLTVGCWLTVG